MKPDQVWQAALGELQLQMTKSTYDTWLRDTQLLECALDPESGMSAYVIGTQSTYTQDWLRKKLYPTIKRTLAGITGGPVEVHFELYESEAAPGAPYSLEPADSAPRVPPGWARLRDALEQSATAPTESQSATPEQRRPDASVTPASKHPLLIQQAYRTAYEAIVRPATIVHIPKVFLKRWVRILGPRPAWLVIAFWQHAYLAGLYQHKRGARQKLGHQEKAQLQVGGRALAKWAGIDPSTFWKYLDNPGFLSWFVSIRDENRGQYHIGADGRPKQDMNKYDVWLTPPLTPADQVHLRTWLQTHASTPDLAGLLSALEQAMQEPIAHLLAADPAAQCPGETEPLPTARIALQAVPGALVSTRVEEEALANLCEDLYMRLYAPHEDYLTVTHYFIHNTLPRIKHGAAWMTVYLRSLCRIDRESGSIENEPWIGGGLETLAELLGVTTTKAVSKWLRKQSNKPGDPWEVSWWAKVIKTHRRSDQRVDMQFRVAFPREVLTGTDRQNWRESLAQYELKTEIPESDEEAEQIRLIEERDRATKPTHRTGETWSKSNKMAEQIQPIGEDDGGTNPTHSAEGSGHKSNREVERIRLSGEGGDGTNPTGRRNRSESLSIKIVVVEESKEKREITNNWDIYALLDATEIFGPLRDAVLETNPPGAGFVAWYLHGVRNRKRGRSRRGIENPAAFAAARLAEGKHACDDERLNRLASLGPAGIAACIYWASSHRAAACPVNWDPAERWNKLIGARVNPGDLGLEQVYQWITATIESGLEPA